MNLYLHILLTGVGATLVMDLWGLLRRRTPDFGLVGRWIGHMPRGVWRHTAIRLASPLRHERLLGWSIHYLVGIAFAALLPLVAGAGWFAQPRLLPALLLGLATVAAPFLVMQPAMGAGCFASRTPNPAAARLQSLQNHGVFGIGLYLAAAALRLTTSI